LKLLDLSQSSKDPDHCFFQLDQEWPRFRSSKEEALQEDPAKYLGIQELESDEFRTVARFIADRLALEHPRHFHWNPQTQVLDSQLTGEILRVSDQSPSVLLKSFSLLVQEDLAIWKLTSDREWLAALSILSPNHWAPAEKLGRSFAAVHQPVAGIEAMNRNARQMAETMIFKGPFTRFAWGVATDRRLNHHPNPPPGISEAQWKGRSFDASKPELYVRVERQCLMPFPDIKCALFTIRTYFESIAEIKEVPHLAESLVAALKSMTPESLVYKGLTGSRDEIIRWIES
jgi:dimethylamine monooxygenase subunit A